MHVVGCQFADERHLGDAVHIHQVVDQCLDAALVVADHVGRRQLAIGLADAHHRDAAAQPRQRQVIRAAVREQRQTVHPAGDIGDRAIVPLRDRRAQQHGLAAMPAFHLETTLHFVGIQRVHQHIRTLEDVLGGEILQIAALRPFDKHVEGIQPQRTGLAAGQAAGVGRGNVVKLARGLEHPFAGGGLDLVRAAERERYRGGGNPRTLRHIVDRCLAHTLYFNRLTRRFPENSTAGTDVRVGGRFFYGP